MSPEPPTVRVAQPLRRSWAAASAASMTSVSSALVALGHGSGTKRPWGSGSWQIKATIGVIHPRRNTRTRRRRVSRRLRRLGGHSAVTSSNVPSGTASSTSPPTRKSYNVATATANHRREARPGSLIRVRCNCHPARLVTLKPCSIQARSPYQAASLASGGTSVRINHGSLSPASQRAKSVQSTCRPCPFKAVPRPLHDVPTSGTKLPSGRDRGEPSGRNVPPLLLRKNGCQPNRTRRWNNQRAYKPRSARTITVQPGGTAGRHCRSIRNHSGRHACFFPASSTTQATGMAQPRESTLMANTTKRSPQVVASRASASCVPVHQLSPHASKGHNRPQRAPPGASFPVWPGPRSTTRAGAAAPWCLSPVSSIGTDFYARR